VWVLAARYGGKNLVRRKLGEYPAMTLAQARDEAHRWRSLIARGVDPKAERRENSFGAVAEAYFADMRRRELRRGYEVERDIRRSLRAWWSRPIRDIARRDVLEVIQAAIDRDTPWAAHHLYSHASGLKLLVGRS
jgi:hypothetical protein